ncbi:DUF1275 family protein [Micromonospora sp. NPDC048169]|uniref:DUF1275 family protein n=1 Tax=Micromonospora sp. NPDC048169 TaxID=3154711 RepID=UPI00340C6062
MHQVGVGLVDRRIPRDRADHLVVLGRSHTGTVSGSGHDEFPSGCGPPRRRPALLAFPVGILGGLVVRTFGVQTATSYQTGTVLRTTKGIADWVFEPEGRSAAGRLAATGLLCLVSYAIGGFVGAATETRPIWTMIVTWALAVVLIAFTWGKRPPATATGRR